MEEFFFLLLLKTTALDWSSRKGKLVTNYTRGSRLYFRGSLKKSNKKIRHFQYIILIYKTKSLRTNIKNDLIIGQISTENYWVLQI